MLNETEIQKVARIAEEKESARLKEILEIDKTISDAKLRLKELNAVEV